MNNYLLYLQNLLSKVSITFLFVIFLSSCTSNNYHLIQKLNDNALNQGESESKFELVRIYSEGKVAPKNISKASKWIKALADDGNEYLLTELAYRKDIGSEETRKLALQYLYAYTQYNIGSLYLSGFNIYSNIAAEYNQENLSENKKENFYSNAFRYFKLSASQGYCPAQHNLGYMYYSGLGTAKNYKESLFWTEKAAKECYYFDYGIHSLLLDLYYSDGFGVKKNIPKAYQEFFLIADKSLNKGNYKRENFYRVIKQLNDDELNELIRYTLDYMSEPTQGITEYNAHNIIINGLLETYFTK